MHNWFAMETEAEFRRHEWEREAANDVRSAQVCAGPSRARTLQLPRVVRTGLERLTAPRSAPAMPLAPHYREAPC